MRFALTQRLVLATLLVLLPLLPPETRGESMAGCAVLLVALGLVTGVGSRVRGGRASLCLVAVAAWPLAAAAASPGAAVAPLATLLLAVAAGVFAASVPREVRNGSLIPWSVASMGTVAAAQAFHQRFWGLERMAAEVEAAGGIAHRDEILTRLGEGRAFGAFATPAALGLFLAMAAAVTFGLAFDRRGRSRWIAAVLGSVQVLGLASTASATAVSALLGATVLLALRFPVARRLALAGGLLLLVVLGGVLAWRGDEILDPEHGSNPFRLRAGNFRVAAEMARDHPWTGVGPGGYGESYSRYRRPGDNESRHAHDLPLEAAAELGLPLGLAAAGVFFWLFLLPILRDPGGARGWRRGAAVALAAFALHNLADFTAYFPSLLWFAALLRGLSADPGEGPARRTTRIPKAAAAVAALAATVLAAVLAARTGLGWNALVEGRNALAANDRIGALESSARAVDLAPWDVDAHLFRAWCLAQSPVRPGETVLAARQALASADLAVTRSPVRASARAVRGRIREALGDLPGAYADLRRANDLYPAHPDYGTERDRLARVTARFYRRGEP